MDVDRRLPLAWACCATSGLDVYYTITPDRLSLKEHWNIIHVLVTAMMYNRGFYIEHSNLNLIDILIKWRRILLHRWVAVLVSRFNLNTSKPAVKCVCHLKVLTASISN